VLPKLFHRFCTNRRDGHGNREDPPVLPVPPVRLVGVGWYGTLIVEQSRRTELDDGHVTVSRLVTNVRTRPRVDCPTTLHSHRATRHRAAVLYGTTGRDQEVVTG